MKKTTEELSVALDQLNCGRIAESNDQEIKELLEIAVLLRNANLPVQPPEHLLTASVERAAAGLATHKASRRNPWLYSGLLGAAAALLVFAGIHGFPSIQEAVQQTTPPTQSEAATPPVSEVKQAPAAEKVAKPQSPVVTRPESPVPAPRLAAAPDRQIVANSPGVTPTPPPTAPRQPVPAPPEARAELDARPSLKSAPATSAPLPTLQLAGRTPDSIIQDIAGGSIRQVFNAGTPQELIITQRRLPQMEKGAALHSKSQAAPETARKYSAGATNLNKVVVTINGQEVTLEGRQTIDELAALAKSLAP